MLKIAIVGAGISGLSCAYRLAQAGQDVTLYEAGSYFGGHSHTVDIELDGQRAGVDTGFLVFNEKTYPQLIKLFAELNVETAASDMSFSVQLPLGKRRLEWGGANLDTVFVQRRNLASPRFLRMLADIVRFNREATALATSASATAMSLGDFLDAGRYSEQFCRWYLLPMAACIWSCPSDQMLAFPATSFLRFCHNHGLLQIEDRPQWRTVLGGSRHYVAKLMAAVQNQRLATPVRHIARVSEAGRTKVRVCTDHSNNWYDHVVLACHSDQSLEVLADATEAERVVLGAVAYQPNRAVLHTDASCLPRSRKAWSAWNYQSRSGDDQCVCVHYLINKLQPLPFQTPVIVSLNPIDAPAPRSVLGEYDYAHPVFDAAAIRAQARLPSIQGQRNTWFAGAWTGYGFHEDGLKSGLAVAASLVEVAHERKVAQHAT